MNLLEFILFNIISSVAFTFMHAGYFPKGESTITLLTNGHLAFSFMLGLITYKTQRIELPIMLHMLSNIFRYTIPVCIFNCPWPSLVAIISALIVDILFSLCLAGCSYKENKTAN